MLVLYVHKAIPRKSNIKKKAYRFRKFTAHFHGAQAQGNYFSREKEINNLWLINLEKQKIKLTLKIYGMMEYNLINVQLRAE